MKEYYTIDEIDTIFKRCADFEELINSCNLLKELMVEGKLCKSKGEAMARLACLRTLELCNKI